MGLVNSITFKVLSTSEILLFPQIYLSFLMNTFVTCLLKMSLLTFCIFPNVILLSIIYEVHINLYMLENLPKVRGFCIFLRFWNFWFKPVWHKICYDNLPFPCYLLALRVKEGRDYILVNRLKKRWSLSLGISIPSRDKWLFPIILLILAPYFISRGWPLEVVH